MMLRTDGPETPSYEMSLLANGPSRRGRLPEQPREPVMTADTPRPRLSHGAGPVGSLIRLFSSVWCGIVLMVLIFAYLTVGSAGFLYPTGLNVFSRADWSYVLPRVLLDKTEMEFFSWWPFTTLIVLFIINMVVVTVRRIPFRLLNLGVWTIHTGIVILAIGSMYYFGTKLEGDTPVFRRHVAIQVPGVDQPRRLVAREGNAVDIDSPSGRYHFAIQDVNPDWPILTGDDKGKRTCSINVAVQTPTQQFIRQLLIGYPQYTEDIIPGKGRAVKSTGQKLLDPDIAMRLDYEPQQYFYLMDSAALYVRELGQRGWRERPIDGLPHYSNHIAAVDEIWQPAGDPIIEPDPLDIPVPAESANDPFAGLDIRVTGRLQYAPNNEAHWVPGGQNLNPIVGIRLADDSGATWHELAAFDPRSNHTNDGLIRFGWVRTQEEFADQARQVGSHLHVQVPAAGAAITIPIDRPSTDDFQQIGDTDWSYQLEHVYRNLQLPSGGNVSVAVIKFRGPDKEFTRWVADLPDHTRDVKEGHAMLPPDPALETTFEVGPIVSLIGGPAESELHLVAGAQQEPIPLEIGRAIDLGQNLRLTPAYVYTHARQEVRPAVVPRHEWRRNAGETFSRIKVVFRQGSWMAVRWLPFHRYPFNSDQYAVPGRFTFDPTVVTLPDGRKLEMLFSRKRAPLPAALALEDFQLATHVGGYTGDTISIRDFVSRLRVYDGGHWSDPFQAKLNHPASYRGMYFFQSEWDPGEMSYTGLGVGNRRGVYVQLAGVCISVAGMLFAFYFKPLIKRRRRLSVLESMQEHKEAAESPEPVAV